MGHGAEPRHKVKNSSNSINLTMLCVFGKIILIGLQNGSLNPANLKNWSKIAIVFNIIWSKTRVLLTRNFFEDVVTSLVSGASESRHTTFSSNSLLQRCA